MSYAKNGRWPLPNSWVWATMGDIAEVVGGGTPDTKISENFGGSVPWITPADMSSHVGKTISHGARWISERGLLDSGARWLPSGSVLFSSRAPIGYVAVSSQPVTTNQGFKSFIPKAGIASDFVYHWLTTAKPLAEELASGTTFLEISGAKASLIPFPVAPTDEQTRIVEKLEELLSDLDAGVAELKAAQKKLALYRQSLLKAAVEGALTADWRARRAARDEPLETGAALLARILTERRARWEARQLARFKEQGKTPPKGWQARYPEPVLPDTADLPTLPEGWVWASVDQLSPDDLANGRSVPSANSGPKVLRLTAIRDGCVDLDEHKCGDWSESDARQFWVTEGDLLIVRGNGSLSLVGRMGRVAETSASIAYPDTMIRLRVLDAVVAPSWINLVWNAHIVRSHIERRARTSAGIYKISQPDITSTPIPVPPICEQRRIEERFGEHVEVLQAIELALATGMKQSAAQRKNLLKAAFSGQLVPQDPNDEPASALLARIRAEREARSHGNLTRRTRKAIHA